MPDRDLDQIIADLQRRRAELEQAMRDRREQEAAGHAADPSSPAEAERDEEDR